MVLGFAAFCERREPLQCVSVWSIKFWAIFEFFLYFMLIVQFLFLFRWLSFVFGGVRMLGVPSSFGCWCLEQWGLWATSHRAAPLLLFSTVELGANM